MEGWGRIAYKCAAFSVAACLSCLGQEGGVMVKWERARMCLMLVLLLHDLEVAAHAHTHHSSLAATFLPL